MPSRLCCDERQPMATERGAGAAPTRRSAESLIAQLPVIQRPTTSGGNRPSSDLCGTKRALDYGCARYQGF